MSMFDKKSIEDIEVKGKRVLVRCDFNVPLDGDKITDESRIKGALPTIKYLKENGAKLILCSHMGKPKGEYKPELSLAPVAKRLSALLDTNVIFNSEAEVVGEKTKAAVDSMKDGDIVLLENTRLEMAKQRMTKVYQKTLLHWLTYLLMTHLVQHTERIHQLLVLHSSLTLQLVATLFKKSSSSLVRLLKHQFVLLQQFLVVPRFLIKSRLSTICSKKLIHL